MSARKEHSSSASSTPPARKPCHVDDHEYGFEHFSNDKRKINHIDHEKTKKRCEPETVGDMSVWVKSQMMGSLCFMALAVSSSSSIFSTAMVLTAKEFNVSPKYMLLGLSLYVIGVACGTLLTSQISAPLGRRNSLVASMAFSVICHMVVGIATDLQTVLASRYFAGFFGSAIVAITPQFASEIPESTERATAIVAFTAALSMGPILGVIGGEFLLLIPTSNWRWTAWAAALSGGFSILLALATLPGKDPPSAHAARAKRQPSSLEDMSGQIQSRIQGERPTHGTIWQAFQTVTCTPVQAVVAICASLIHGLLYMTLVIYPMSFEIDRAFPFGRSSLPSLAILAGILIGSAHLVREATRLRFSIEAKAQTTYPGHHLSLMRYGCYTLSMGLFIFAWTSYRDTNPWPQISSGVLIGYGIIVVLSPALIHLVDATSASPVTLSAYAVLQGTIASILPLVVIPMYQRLGVQLSTNLVATMCLMVALVLSISSSTKFVYYRPAPGGIAGDAATHSPNILPSQQTNYGQTKVSNVLLAHETQQSLRQHNIVSVWFNPGNLRTELQRHLKGVMACVVDLTLHPAIYGAYTELYSGWSGDVKPDDLYIMPWGRRGADLGEKGYSGRDREGAGGEVLGLV